MYVLELLLCLDAFHKAIHVPQTCCFMNLDCATWIVGLNHFCVLNLVNTCTADMNLINYICKSYYCLDLYIHMI
jgi:hypothetical protein